MLNLQLEVTTKCNLSCVECPHRMMRRPTMHMSDEVFARIVNDYIPALDPDAVILNKDGEPLLHPKINDMLLQIADKTEAPIDIYTNGIPIKQSLFDTIAKMENKVRLLVTFHYHDADGNEYDYDAVESALIDGLNTWYPNENLHMILVTHMTDFMSEEKAAAWQKRWLSISGMHPYLYAVHINRTINSWAGLIKQKNNTPPYRQCLYHHFDFLFIGVTGKVVGCCGDIEEETAFGHIDEEPHLTMERAHAFYAQIAAEKANIGYDVCRRCISDV